MRTTAKNARGFTLIELMISIVIGLITVAATLALYITIFKGSIIAIRSSRLNHDVDSVLLLMQNDIRRAGYWNGAVAGYDPTDASTQNPFQVTGSSQLNISGTDSECITYSYDANSDGSISDDERFGFKLADDAVWIRISAPTATATSCADADGNWQELTVTDGTEIVKVSDLIFTPSYTCHNVDDSSVPSASATACEASFGVSGERIVERLEVDIQIIAASGRDGEITKDATTTTTVANDRIFKI